MRSSLMHFLIAFFIVYLGLVLLLYLFQDRLIYFPDKRIIATPDEVGLAFERVSFRTRDGVQISAWHVPSGKERAVVLFCHGNGGNISYRLDYLKIFAELGLSTFMFDYRGYGASAGSPSEEGTYLDALGAWQFLVEQKGVDPRKIVVFGESLGGAIAAWLAREKSPRALILQSAFTSLPDVAADVYPFMPARLLARYDYHTLRYLTGVRCPVLVIHSKDDEIVPFKHGLQLYNGAGAPKELMELRGDHNSGFLTSLETYKNGLDAFLDRFLPK